ncbi:hypothetical protein M9458_036796, partial [Cirrhinus mrigala]
MFQGWDVPFFSEQDYLDLYTALSDSDADQRNQEQVNSDMKNEETAGAPAGSAPLRSPELIQPIANKSCDGVTM